MWRPQCSVVAEIAGAIPGIDVMLFDWLNYKSWLGRRRDGKAMRSQWGAIHANM